MSNLERDYIWEFDYANRRPVIDELAILLNTQNAYQLSMCSLFVNNNPYNFEFLVALGYEQPVEHQIKEMKARMRKAGGTQRTDITVTDLLTSWSKKQFNTATVPNEELLRHCIKTLFLFPESEDLSKKWGSGIKSQKSHVFLSHSSKDKPLVEEVIPYLVREGIRAWYDSFNIDYGDSLVSKIQDGIDSSKSVIFFISQNFLNSNWCKSEMEAFLTNNASQNNLLILSVVFPDISHEELPTFIRNKKYLRLDADPAAPEIALKLMPALKKHHR